MVIRIEILDDLDEDEIIIKCKQFTDDIERIHRAMILEIKSEKSIALFKGDEELFLPVEEILFFETTSQGVCAHSRKDIFQTKLKLYELEKILPNSFIRVSKSTIVNSKQVLSITKKIGTSSRVQFYDTHKQIYVSRNYYQELRRKLQERTYHEK